MIFCEALLDRTNLTFKRDPDPLEFTIAPIFRNPKAFKVVKIDMHSNRDMTNSYS